jgi:mannose-6-phosphate isomerase-like protein (cupin superfamily)
VSTYAVARLGEVEPRGPGGNWIALRRDLGIEAFGVNAWTGAEPVGPHDEAELRHEELYVVLSGRASFDLGGETVDAPAGTLVHVRAGVHRAARSLEDGTVVLAVGARPGEPFTPSPWEDDAETFPLLAAGEVERARELLRDAVVRHPGHAALRYNLACAEARLGAPDEALAHLARALELNPELAETARTDADLAAVRDDPRFAALVSRG